ncbi:uncharacterized protein METZ01_LOCUS179312 [marine metagenome]|uniref:Uncharacterized protein n=1 Tax=marine metagenome TaxID=408172 RepID=A0A382CJT2_9ZZZZ
MSLAKYISVNIPLQLFTTLQMGIIKGPVLLGKAGPYRWRA